jgi:hypothetical protein
MAQASPSRTGPELPPEAAGLAFLLGTWRGEGLGDYPTVQPFRYGEEVRFWHVGKPFLAYAQRTWSLADRTPLHGEMGYWRPSPGGRVELVVAHPTGIVEVAEGTVEGTSIQLASTVVARTRTAKEVLRLERTLRVEGDVLRYELRMAAVGVPLTRHLAGELHRVPEPG